MQIALASKEHNICHFYFFKNRNFLCQSLVCNGYHDASLHAYFVKGYKNYSS